METFAAASKDCRRSYAFSTCGLNLLSTQTWPGHTMNFFASMTIRDASGLELGQPVIDPYNLWRLFWCFGLHWPITMATQMTQWVTQNSKTSWFKACAPKGCLSLFVQAARGGSCWRQTGGWPFILDQNLIEKLCWPPLVATLRPSSSDHQAAH